MNRQFFKTASLMSFTPEEINFTGCPVPAAGYYGPTTGFHTLSIRTLNFIGSVYIEGSLAVAPTDSDWFPILLDGMTGIMFSETLNPPDDMALIGYMGQTTCLYYNFVSNCNWLRARVVRDYIIPNFSCPQQISNYGQIDNILVAF